MHAGYHDTPAFDRAVSDSVARAGGRALERAIGRTVEGAPIRAVTVGASDGPPDRTRPQVMVIAAIHGCEEISSELALAVLESVCDDSAESRVVSSVADLTVVPAINLDGRARSIRSLDRRGLVASAPRRNTNGVDLNRN